MDEEMETHGGKKQKVEFETVTAEKKPFGKNNFIEVARKRAKTDEGVNEFISVSRAITSQTGARGSSAR